MMLLVPVSSPSSSVSHGVVMRYCASMSEIKVPTGQCRRARDAHQLNPGVDGRNLIRVQGNFPRCRQKPSSSASRARLTGKLDVPNAAGAKRRFIDVSVGAAQPLGVALQRFRIGKDVMTERNRLRLDAHSVSGHDRVGDTSRQNRAAPLSRY